MEFLGRNGHPVSLVTMHDMTGCNLGGDILSYQNKYLWLLPCKQSSTSHCTLSYGLPLSFCMSKTGKKNFPGLRNFYPANTHRLGSSAQHSAGWPVLLQGAGQRLALVACRQGPPASSGCLSARRGQDRKPVAGPSPENCGAILNIFCSSV